MVSLASKLDPADLNGLLTGSACCPRSDARSADRRSPYRLDTRHSTLLAPPASSYHLQSAPVSDTTRTTPSSMSMSQYLHYSLTPPPTFTSTAHSAQCTVHSAQRTPPCHRPSTLELEAPSSPSRTRTPARRTRDSRTPPVYVQTRPPVRLSARPHVRPNRARARTPNPKVKARPSATAPPHDESPARHHHPDSSDPSPRTLATSGLKLRGRHRPMCAPTVRASYSDAR